MSEEFGIDESLEGVTDEELGDGFTALLNGKGKGELMTLGAFVDELTKCQND